MRVNPELPTLACHAAVEIYEPELGREWNYRNTKELIQTLRTSVQEYKSNTAILYSSVWCDLIIDVFDISEKSERDRHLKANETLQAGLELITEQISLYETQPQQAYRLCLKISKIASKHVNPFGFRHYLVA